MMGPRKLRSIRDELRHVLAKSAAADPVDTKDSGLTREKGREVLDSLERILNSADKPRKRRAARLAE
jgi:hypothetical protein